MIKLFLILISLNTAFASTQYRKLDDISKPRDKSKDEPLPF